MKCFVGTSVHIIVTMMNTKMIFSHRWLHLFLCLFWICVHFQPLHVVLANEEQISTPSLGAILGISMCPEKVVLSYPQIPEFFDARQVWPNCLPPVRNQGNCGSCWAFASSSALTTRFCIATWNGTSGTTKRLLSPQNLVDCDHTCRILFAGCNMGCSGGYLDNVWQYLEDKGVVGETCYPYVSGTTGSETPCSSTCTASSPSSQKYKSLACYKLSGVRTIQADILLYGPVMAGFEVYRDFFSYRGGVYIRNSNELIGGHAVILIGWGVDQNGTEYWIAQNSWGTWWGENGYFRIRRGTNECSLEDNVVCALPNLNSVNPEYEEYPGMYGTTTSLTSGSSSTFYPSPSQGTYPSSVSTSSSSPSSSSTFISTSSSSSTTTPPTTNSWPSLPFSPSQIIPSALQQSSQGIAMNILWYIFWNVSLLMIGREIALIVLSL